MEIVEIKSENTSIIEKSVKKYAEKTKYDYANKVQNCLDFLYQTFEVKNLLEYDFEEFLALFEWIEEKPIIKITKKRYRWYLKNVIMAALKSEISHGKTERLAFFNYLFSDHCFTFSESGKKRQLIRIEVSEIKALLDQARINDINDYIMFMILSYSGCRASGLINLKYEDIDFQNACFITQEKKTKDSAGLNLYFLPKIAIEQINVYCLRNDIKTGKLFDCNYQKLQYKLKQYRPDLWIHLFRHAIRIHWHEKGMDSIDAHFLLSHAPKNIDEQYLKTLNTKERLRAIYDKFFPY